MSLRSKRALAVVLGLGFATAALVLASAATNEPDELNDFTSLIEEEGPRPIRAGEIDHNFQVLAQRIEALHLENAALQTTVAALKGESGPSPSTLYVRTDGHDALCDGSANAPASAAPACAFASAQRAIDALPATVTQPTEIVVGEGVYESAPGAPAFISFDRVRVDTGRGATLTLRGTLATNQPQTIFAYALPEGEGAVADSPEVGIHLRGVAVRLADLRVEGFRSGIRATHGADLSLAGKVEVETDVFGLEVLHGATVQTEAQADIVTEASAMGVLVAYSSTFFNRADGAEVTATGTGDFGVGIDVSASSMIGIGAPSASAAAAKLVAAGREIGTQVRWGSTLSVTGKAEFVPSLIGAPMTRDRAAIAAMWGATVFADTSTNPSSIKLTNNSNDISATYGILNVNSAVDISCALHNSQVPYAFEYAVKSSYSGVSAIAGSYWKPTANEIQVKVESGAMLNSSVPKLNCSVVEPNTNWYKTGAQATNSWCE